MSRWFRLYDDVINDPKILRLSDSMFRAWMTLLCLASKHDGALPSTNDIALVLRLKGTKIAEWLAMLTAAGLLDNDEGTFRPHNWDRRQFVSDVSTDRVQRYRDKRKASGLPALGDYTKFKPALIARDGERCIYCEATARLVVDHMVPITLGGTDHDDNLALACKPCNSGKSGRTPELANMTIRVTTASDALRRYRDNRSNVTVTETASYTESETDNRIRPERKTRASALAEPWTEADWLQFWERYPNKIGKADARKAFERATKKTIPEKLFPALGLYANKTDDRAFCNPSTWLNQERWLDEPAKAANGQRTNGFHPNSGAGPPSTRDASVIAGMGRALDRRRADRAAANGNGELRGHPDAAGGDAAERDAAASDDSPSGQLALVPARHAGQ